MTSIANDTPMVAGAGGCIQFDNYLTGSLDEQMIWSKALSQSEIQRMIANLTR